jgi:hypothetical protein
MVAASYPHDAISGKKAAVKIATPYGIRYSPHYLRTNRSTMP